MSGRFHFFRRAAVLLIFCFTGLSAHATIGYTISLSHPERHTFGVTMHVPNVHGQLVLQIPAWNALYQIRDFSSHMMQVSAKDDEGQALALRKVDKDTWSVDATAAGAVTVSYPVYWDEPGPFATQLNAEHAFINLAMILLYVPDRRTEDTQVGFQDVPDGWHIAVELDPAEAPTGANAAPGPSYAAPSYDALVDAPVEIGRFDELRIEAGGKPIRIVIHGDAGDRNLLKEELKAIVNYDVSLMGGAPFREYMFVFHVGSNFGGGGMEHMNCTAIATEMPNQLPSYSAHEFFHLWNVKRIRPQSLEPVDYTHEMWTRSLWFAEGVTSTYASYALLRSGLWSAQQFYADLSEQISELQSRPAHRWQSVEQSSLDAWLEKYSIYLRPEESISYYTKGQIVGVLLDLLIRDRTDNRASLDTVMRTLNEDYAKRGRFYDDSYGLRQEMEKVIREKAPAANADLTNFFTRYISGTDEIPYDDFLGRAGLSLRDTSQRHAAFGFAITRDSAGNAVAGTVDGDSDAGRAGVQEGDFIIAVNGEPFPRMPSRWLRNRQPDDHVTLKIRRGSEEKEISFMLSRQGEAIYQIVELPGGTEKQLRIRDGILRGITTR